MTGFIKQTGFVLLVILSIVSCKKSTSSADDSSSSGSLNATEKQLVGKWTLDSKIDSINVGVQGMEQINSYSSFSSPLYYEFKDNSVVSGFNTNLKEAYDGGAMFGPYPGNPGTVSGTKNWKFDDTNKLLDISQINFNIVSLTSSKLILEFRFPSMNTIYTWRLTKQ